MARTMPFWKKNKTGTDQKSASLARGKTTAHESGDGPIQRDYHRRSENKTSDFLKAPLSREQKDDRHKRFLDLGQGDGGNMSILDPKYQAVLKTQPFRKPVSTR